MRQRRGSKTCPRPGFADLRCDTQLFIRSFELGVVFLPRLYAGAADDSWHARRFSCTPNHPSLGMQGQAGKGQSSWGRGQSCGYSGEGEVHGGRAIAASTDGAATGGSRLSSDSSRRSSSHCMFATTNLMRPVDAATGPSARPGSTTAVMLFPVPFALPPTPYDYAAGDEVGTPRATFMGGVLHGAHDYMYTQLLPASSYAAAAGAPPSSLCYPVLSGSFSLTALFPRPSLPLRHPSAHRPLCYDVAIHVGSHALSR